MISYKKNKNIYDVDSVSWVFLSLKVNLKYHNWKLL